MGYACEDSVSQCSQVFRLGPRAVLNCDGEAGCWLLVTSPSLWAANYTVDKESAAYVLGDSNSRAPAWFDGCFVTPITLQYPNLWPFREFKTTECTKGFQCPSRNTEAPVGDDDDMTLQQQYGTWISPDGPEVWFVGDTKKISFDVEFVTFTVLLYQLDPKSGGIWPNNTVVYQALTGIKEFDWVVQTYGTDMTLSDTFFFWLFNGTDLSERGNDKYPHLKSPNLRIKEAEENTSSAITSATTATTAALSNSATLTTSTSAAATSTITTPQPSESSGSSNSTSIGVGVGVGVAVALVLALAAAYYLLWFRKKKKSTGGNDAAPETSSGDNYMYGDNTGPEELHANSMQPAVGFARPPSYHKVSQTPESWELDSTPRARLSGPVELGPGK